MTDPDDLPDWLRGEAGAQTKRVSHPAAGRARLRKIQVSDDCIFWVVNREVPDEQRHPVNQRRLARLTALLQRWLPMARPPRG